MSSSSLGELFTIKFSRHGESRHDLDLALFEGLTSKEEGRFHPLLTRTSQTRKRIFAQSDLTVRTRKESDGLNKDL